MSILVDTSVWVDYFKYGNDLLARLLRSGLVICHPYIIIELACGTPPDRSEILKRLGDLNIIPVVTSDELLTFIHRHKIYGQGCGMVDTALLAATLMKPGTSLWTLDKRRLSLAEEFNCAYHSVQ